MKKLSLLFLVTIIVAFNGLSYSQTILYGPTASTITQTFDGLPNTGTFTFTGNGPFQLSDAPVSATGMAGWYGCKYTGSATANMLFKVDDGTNNSGSVLSLGTVSSTDRALGSNASGTQTEEIGALITNNSGVELNKITITFTGEQWRTGGSNAVVNTLSFQYKIGATTIDDATGYTANTALDFASPFNSGTGGGNSLDGNAAANHTVGITATISGLVWPAGTILGIRWRDNNDTGNDDALGIDDWSFKAEVQPPTDYYFNGTAGGLNTVTNWGTATNGTGSNPANFSNPLQIFNLRNGTNAYTTAASWAVSGTGSKIVVGDGSTPYTLTVANGFPVTGTMDVSANGTVVLQDATIPSLSSLDLTSTIDYQQTTSIVVSNSPVYGNLNLTGGTKTFNTGTTTITGNFVVNNVTDLDGSPSPFSTVSVAKNLTFSGTTTFIASDANRFTLLCSGTTLQTITGNGIALKFFQFSVPNTAGVVLSTSGGTTNVTAGGPAGGGLTTGGGSITTNSNLITLYASFFSQVLNEGAGHLIIGNISGTKSVGTSTTTFGNLLWGTGLIAGTVTDNLGNVTVLRKTGTDGIVTVSGKSGIQCTWTVSSVNPPASGRSIKLGWIDPDLTNGKTITTMQAWKSEDGGTSWHLAGSQYDATVRSTLDSLGVNSFGMFTISDIANPLGVLTPSIGITALIEGRYNSSANPHLMNSGIMPDANEYSPATVTVGLYNTSGVLITSATGDLDKYGTHTFNFPAGTGGTNYWIRITSPNTLETWSANATSSTSDFIFDTTVTKAYTDGSSPTAMVQVNPGARPDTKWCIYSGDVGNISFPQDGGIDGTDVGNVFNDNAGGTPGGYAGYPTDLNGDQGTDITDIGIVFNNNLIGPYARIPSLPLLAKRIVHPPVKLLEKNTK